MQLPWASGAALTSLSRDALPGLRVQANICAVKLHFLRLLIGSSRIYLQSPQETHVSQIPDWKGKNGQLALLGLELLSLHPSKHRETPLGHEQYEDRVLMGVARARCRTCVLHAVV